MWESIVNAFKSFFERVVNWVKKIINGILNFARDVVAYFKGLKLRKGKDLGTIFDEKKLREMIQSARSIDVGLGLQKPESIVEATYNLDTDELENVRELQADALDETTKSLLENEPLVVLT